MHRTTATALTGQPGWVIGIAADSLALAASSASFHSLTGTGRAPLVDRQLAHAPARSKYSKR
jgi:hypothetical protein